MLALRLSRAGAVVAAALALAASLPCGGSPASALPAPAETVAVPSVSSEPIDTGIEGRWAIGSGAAVIRFTIQGEQLSGTTPCGPFAARLVRRAERVRIVNLSIPATCPRQWRSSQARFQVQLEQTQSLTIHDGRLVARDGRGVTLFVAERQAPAPGTTGALVLDGAWAPLTPQGSSERPILRIQGSSLTVAGACNDYAGSISSGPLTSQPVPVRITITSASQRLCALPEARRADAMLLTTLEAVRFLRFSTGRIELRGESGRLLLTLARL